MAHDQVRLVPLPGKGPEDVAIGPDGTVYTGLADGRIVALPPDSPPRVVARIEGDRPYGVEMHGDGELVVCAASAGALVVDIRAGTATSLVSAFAGRRFLTCNNSAVASDGTVYFSESSQVHAMARYLVDLVQSTRTGRLFRKAPGSGAELLCEGIDFANGVALAPDERSVFVAETATGRVRRVWLEGPEQGKNDVFADGLPGYPDNLASAADGGLWVAVPSKRDPLLEALRAAPKPAQSLIKILPPKAGELLAKGETVAVKLDGTGNVVREARIKQRGFQTLTGMREHGGELWCGSLYSPALAVVPL
ncbi:MAG: SMP-30/gluconolactonase/LRE family protein [Segniliparus sp.]|uniref:SMP-30/gluconolactonase/LRE family protein n=1 Tax=Segniliparus sp. TaxID=2804064 RepID=UPI003F2CCFB0